MAYADLATVQDTDPGDILTAAWCDQSRDNHEFHIDPPATSVQGTSTQSVADNTTTALNAGTENFDNDSMHSTSVNTSRITVQTTGRYLIYATVAFAADAAGFRRVSLRVDGTTAYGGMQVVAAGAQPIRIQATRALPLTAGQYVEATCLHNVGSAIDVTLDEFVAIFLTR